METIANTELLNREQAGRVLSRKLEVYKSDNTVVVGIPYGGVCVASAVADALNSPLEVLPCRKIKHPADSSKSIGSVSPGDVVIHDELQGIPQDYIFHQVALLRNAMQYENKLYYGDRRLSSFRYKTVILVDDLLTSADAMLACIRAIKKDNPLKVIVAVPVVSAEAARVVGAEADDLAFIKIVSGTILAKNYFVDFPKVDESKVKSLLMGSRKSACVMA